MDIQEIINSGADITLKVRSKDLKELLDGILDKFDKRIKDHIVKEEEYFTIKETTEFLHVSKSTLDNWNKSGYLCKREVGGRRLYKKSDVEEILNRK